MGGHQTNLTKLAPSILELGWHSKFDLDCIKNKIVKPNQNKQEKWDKITIKFI